jgi:transposase
LQALPADSTMMIVDRGYDGDWFRQALSGLEILSGVLGRSSRKVPVTYNAKIQKQRNLVERMSGRLKNRRWVATRFGRCTHIFMSAICIAAAVIFWLWVFSLAKIRSAPHRRCDDPSPQTGLLLGLSEN